MPRIEGSYPPPIHGVSTVKPRNRGEGYCELQENFHADVVSHLTRRPPLQWLGKLADFDEDFAYHRYARGDDVYRIFVIPQQAPGNSNVVVYKNTTKLTSNATQIPVTLETIHSLKFMTVKDTTYVCNTALTPDFELMEITDPPLPPEEAPHYLVEDHPTAGCTIEKVSHINFTVAAEYGEQFDVLVDGINMWSFRTPVYSPEAADTQADRGTSELAELCALDINTNGNVSGIFATNRGSSVAVWRALPGGNGTIPADERSPYPWVRVEVLAGQGDRSAVPINERIEKVDGLPLYAVAGTRITVRPNPRSDDGTYYLQADPIEGDHPVNKHGRIMQEVVWTEDRSPHEPYKLDVQLLPFQIEVLENDNVEVQETPWKDRRTGNDESCPPPSFLASKTRITDMSYFQNRLVLLSDDEVHMTETDDLDNWWKASAIQLLVTDPIGISSSAENVDALTQAVPHNRDLLVLAKNGQFKIDGKQAVTPQTVSMQLTTDYEVQTEPPPVAIGNAVYIPMVFGNSAGLHEYTGEPDTQQDTAFNIATHIRGYIPGEIELLVSSPNLEFIALTATGDTDNVIYVYQQHTNQVGKRVQAAWYKWVLPIDTQIVHMSMTNDDLELLTQEGEEVHIYTITVHSNDGLAVNELGINGGLPEIYLDKHIVLDTTGLTATLPEGYPLTEHTKIVRGSGTNYPRTLVEYTVDGSDITLLEDVGQGSLEIGECFTSSYIPSRPFKRDEKGVAVTTDRIRVSRYRVSVIESYEMWMHIHSDYYDGEDQAFNSRIMNANNNLVGYEPHSTDEVLFGFSQDAKYALPEFYTDGFLALTIDNILWEGQYYQTSKRM